MKKIVILFNSLCLCCMIQPLKAQHKYDSHPQETQDTSIRKRNPQTRDTNWNNKSYNRDSSRHKINPDYNPNRRYAPSKTNPKNSYTNTPSKTDTTYKKKNVPK